MPTLNNSKNQDISKDNLSDNLLIKDKDGRLHHLNSPNKNANIGLGSDKKPENTHNLSLAPSDASFSNERYISGTADSKSDFSFHPEDEQQLKEIAKNVPHDDSKKYSVDKIADRLIEKQALKFDVNNKKIFIDTLFDFFRNRKKVPVVRDIFSSKIKSANKQLSADVVDNIISVIKGIKTKVDIESGLVVRMTEMEKPPIQIQPEISEKKLPDIAPPKIVYDLDKEGEVGDVQQEIAKFLGEVPKQTIDLKEKSNIQKPLETEEKGEEEEKPVPIPVKIAESKPQPKPKEDKGPDSGFEMPKIKIEDQKKPKPESKPAEMPKPAESLTPLPVVDVSLPKVVRPNQQTVVKNQISDVKTKPAPIISASPIKHALTGPVQELQDFDLHSWRNLGNDAESRATRLMEKINILEKESFTKKAQGIDAWRKSKIYQEYLDLGAESMVQNKEVSALISEYEQQGRETMTIEEFSAISDLNKKLRF